MKAFYISPTGTVKYIAELPEEPVNQRNVTAEYAEIIVNYQQQLQAAKDSAVDLADSDDAYILYEVAPNKDDHRPDSIHPFPEGYEVEVKRLSVEVGPLQCDWQLVKRAVITPKKEEPKQSIKEELPLNFWKRLYDFVENVQVNDLPGEEEKEMILHVAKRLKGR